MWGIKEPVRTTVWAPTGKSGQLLYLRCSCWFVDGQSTWPGFLCNVLDEKFIISNDVMQFTEHGYEWYRRKENDCVGLLSPLFILKFIRWRPFCQPCLHGVSLTSFRWWNSLQVHCGDPVNVPRTGAPNVTWSWRPVAAPVDPERLQICSFGQVK